MRVAVSVLTRPQPFRYINPDDPLVRLRPHVDGVIIERGWRRAAYLPQVWEKLPDPCEFITHLRMKAGLPADDYRRPGLEVLCPPRHGIPKGGLRRRGPQAVPRCEHPG